MTIEYRHSDKDRRRASKRPLWTAVDDGHHHRPPSTTIGDCCQQQSLTAIDDGPQRQRPLTHRLRRQFEQTRSQRYTCKRGLFMHHLISTPLAPAAPAAVPRALKLMCDLGAHERICWPSPTKVLFIIEPCQTIEFPSAQSHSAPPRGSGTLGGASARWALLRTCSLQEKRGV